MRACLGHRSTPTDWVIAAVLGEGQVEVYEMSLGRLNVSINAEHSIGEIEVEERGHVAVCVNVRVDDQSVGFRIICHLSFFDAPCESRLNVPFKTSCPVEVLCALSHWPI